MPGQFARHVFRHATIAISWNCFCPDPVYPEGSHFGRTEIGDADQEARSEPSGGTRRRFRMAHLARRYTQDLAMAADDGDRCRRHRGRNLFARADRSLEWVAGASDKRQRALARRRSQALPSPGLSKRKPSASSVQFTPWRVSQPNVSRSATPRLDRRRRAVAFTTFGRHGREPA